MWGIMRRYYFLPESNKVVAVTYRESKYIRSDYEDAIGLPSRMVKTSYKTELYYDTEYLHKDALTKKGLAYIKKQNKN